MLLAAPRLATGQDADPSDGDAPRTTAEAQDPAAGAPDAPDPARAGAYPFVVAKMLASEGDLEAAGEAFEEALAEAPDEPFLRLEYASYLVDLAEQRTVARRRQLLDRALEQAQRARDLAGDEPAVWRVLGQVYLDLARREPAALEQARTAFERVLAAEPDDLETALTLGQIHLNQGRAGEAADVLGGVVQRTSGNRFVYSLYGEALLRAGRKAEAEEVLGRLLELDPASRSVRLSLAELESDRGAHEEALDTLQGAPDSMLEEPAVQRRVARELFHLEEYDDAGQVLATYVGGPVEAPDDAVVAALVAAGQGDLERMRQHLALVEASDPRQIEVAGALVEEELMRAAEVALADALDRLDEKRHESLAVRMRTFLSEVRFQLQGLDPALAALRGGDGDVRSLTAKQFELMLRAGEDRRARRLADRVLRRDEPRLWSLLAQVAQALQRYELSLPLVEASLEESPSDPGLLFLHGVANERTGRFDRAVEAFRTLLEEEPDNAQTLNYLGYMWAERGENLDEARALIERAVELEPDSGAYLDSLGWVHYKLGDLDEARRHLEHAASLVDDAVIFEHLGDVHAELGQDDEAADAYRRALDAGPESPDAVRRKLEAVQGP